MGDFDKLLQNAPPRLQTALLDSGFRHLTGESIGDATQWIGLVNRLAPGQREKGVEAIARALAQRSPEEGFAWAQSLGNPVERSAAQAGAVAGIARTNPQIATQWLNAMPPGLDRDHATAAFIKRIEHDQPQEAWAWASAIGDSLLRDDASRSVIKQIEERDRNLARRWLESSSISAATKAELLAGLGLKPGETK